MSDKTRDYVKIGKLRVWRWTTTNPGFTHTSFNVRYGDSTMVYGENGTAFHLSVHVKHKNTRLSDSTDKYFPKWGWHYGFRIDFDAEHNEWDMRSEHVAALKKAQRHCRCTRCGREELGEPGLRLPEGWDFIHRMDFCEECISTNSYKDLMATSGMKYEFEIGDRG
jgi:hypothetical protein